MEKKTVPGRRFTFAVAMVALLAGICAAGVGTAGAAELKGGDLGKLHARMGVECPQCHVNAKKPEPVTMEKCLSCHGDTQKLAAKTAKVTPRNPHVSGHYGTEADCNLCHHQHRKSENFCLPCHGRFNFIVP
jgi:hypothetical protein